MENISLNPGAEETAAELKKQGYEIAIITGSFDVIALKIKEKININNLIVYDKILNEILS